MYDVHSLNKQTFYISCKGSDPYSVFIPSGRDSIYSRLKFFLSIGGGWGGGGGDSLLQIYFLKCKYTKKRVNNYQGDSAPQPPNPPTPLPRTSMLLHVCDMAIFLGGLKLRQEHRLTSDFPISCCYLFYAEELTVKSVPFKINDHHKGRLKP